MAAEKGTSGRKDADNLHNLHGTDAKNSRFTGKSWLWRHGQPACQPAYDKAALIEDVWGESKKETIPEPVYEWVWHEKNIDVGWVVSGLSRILADELTFCQAHDVGRPELPQRHDYAHCAYLLLQDGYGEVPVGIVADALDRIGWPDSNMCEQPHHS